MRAAEIRKWFPAFIDGDVQASFQMILAKNGE